jgi:predicted transcriptional regulator YdeE
LDFTDLNVDGEAERSNPGTSCGRAHSRDVKGELTEIELQKRDSIKSNVNDETHTVDPIAPDVDSDISEIEDEMAEIELQRCDYTKSNVHNETQTVDPITADVDSPPLHERLRTG